MIHAYYDSTYLFKLQCIEAGSSEVRAHASTITAISSAVLARAEFVSACHRKVREGQATLHHLRSMLDQFHLDCNTGVISLLPLNDKMFERVEKTYLTSLGLQPLRAADALHLACAAEHGFREVYSNDRHFLAAAPHFGLKGINVIV